MPQSLPAAPNPPGSLLSAVPATDTVGGTITAVSVAGPTQLTFAADHGLQTGASITVAGTVTTPTTAGTFVVTVVDSTHVTIPVTVTAVTTGTGTATARTLVQQVGVAGATVAVSGSVTRPANTTSYSAGQVVGTASTDVVAIAGAARKPGGSGVILGALVIDQGGAAAAAALELYLFTASPTAQADQAALALVAADLAALVAVVPVAGSYVTNVAATIAGSRAYVIQGVNAAFVCAGGGTTLYGVLVQRAAYTPISAESWTVVLQIGQD